jgi:alpha-tubulin suppressor-like RCC1 family protein
MPRLDLPRCVVVAIALALACSPGERRLRWEMVFAPMTLGTRAVIVEGRILQGGCGGAEIYRAEAGRGEVPAMAPRLDPGRYGFAGRSRDASCIWFAEGCEERDVPLGEGALVTITLAPTTETPACAPSECSAGACASGDAGLRDSGPRDAGDAAVECTIDADCPECRRCEMNSCVAMTDGMPCTGGSCFIGACCTGCWDGMFCRPGDVVAQCGAAGDDCEMCSGATPFCDGGCVGPRMIESVSVGSFFACVIAADSTAWCWGSNAAGELARAPVGAGNESDVPVRIGTTADWELVGAGDEHACALRADGTTSCWGDNMDGQLGTGDMTDRTTPTLSMAMGAWTEIEGGVIGDHTCFMEGTALSCMGQNDYGQLGAGDMTSRTSPFVVPGTWAEVGMGHHDTCGIRTDGTLWCWGQNLHGQLGDGMSGTMNRTSPGQVGTMTGWTDVEIGDHHVCAVRAGELWCWGFDADGQVGDGLTADVLVPTRIGTATNWRDVAAGLAHSCGVRTDGTLWCWGRNASGQLGLGTTGADRLTPVQVGTATDWIEVQAGETYTCGLRMGNRLFCWGSNALGELAQGDRTARSSPIEVIIPRP